jgi:hypothetical protein
MLRRCECFTFETCILKLQAAYYRLKVTPWFSKTKGLRLSKTNFGTYSIVFVCLTFSTSLLFAESHENNTPLSELAPEETKFITVTLPGKVENILEDGNILLEGGIVLRQWAVSLTNIEASRTFLIGKELHCRAVHSSVSSIALVSYQGYAGVFDCDVIPYAGPKSHSRADWLSLYAWAADLQFGEVRCSSADYMPVSAISIQHMEGYNYQCHGTLSLRQALLDD